MERLEWSDLYRTDIPLVDEQHHKPFDMINEIADRLGQGGIDQDTVEAALDGLVECAHQHFVDEEREMVHHAVDQRHQRVQRMEHSSFIYDLDRLRSYTDDDGELEDQYEEILQFTASWLIYHTLRTDQKMAIQVKEIQKGQSPAEAFDYAESHPLKPAVYHKIIEAVVHLWTDSLERVAALENQVKALRG